MDDLNLPGTHVVVSIPPNLSPLQDQFTPPTTPCESSSTSTYQDFHNLPYYQKPVKKRMKWIKIDENYHGLRSSGVSIAKPKAKYTKKPDPNAPKITAPCSVCGRKFWSWKALFGHMRCHPERQWRGINPPSNLRTAISVSKLSGNSSNDHQCKMSMKDQEAADWLLMLANGPAASDSPTITNVCNVVSNEAGCMEDDSKVVVRSPPVDDTCPPGGAVGRFECSSCRKVFGSHQALGGHRASHRNVKGCFANDKNDHDEEYVQTEDLSFETVEDRMIRASGHQCGICLRLFSSGQALGGHKRCHWDKGDEPLGFTQLFVPDLVPVSAAREGCCWDLNLGAPLDYGACCSYSSVTDLDLRLGL